MKVEFEYEVDMPPSDTQEYHNLIVAWFLDLGPEGQDEYTGEREDLAAWLVYKYMGGDYTSLVRQVEIRTEE